MRPRLRPIAAALLTAAAAIGGLSACDLGLKEKFEDDAKVSQRVSAVRIDGNSGSITLHGKPGTTTTEIHRTVRYRDDRPDGPTHRVENGVLVLADCGNDCTVDYEVTVPAGIPVSGKITSGAVDLTSVGAVQVKATSGAVDLSDITGPVDIKATSGSVKARGLKDGPVKVKATSGAVDLALTSPQNVEADLTSGSLTVRAPAGPYRVTTDTDSGSKHISIPQSPSAPHHLDLSTSSGSITVKNG
ncbi:DUF4097 family beta strand repeat-containing protein [Streptomyces huiliensis]|uniref:DUF4097 family beta strand repeat-containing protein n=1 Tax=Streptomyces huiliensis TaxID=2876027 RepID=UPI001CBE2BF1|nr:DUF4097 family beta strand repeat-containing protein [Streptomyces huiliensis]MBZ4322784.1 DUF4097 domain-containing protein [Streptomyces huiliensis]